MPANADPQSLRQIPGVGENMEQHLHRAGVHSLADLKGNDPEALYHRDCIAAGGHVDRCVLYVFRLAVYYAEHKTRDPEKLKWWYWKDQIT